MLIHELRKLARAEEFFNSGDDGPNVDKILRSDDIRVLSGHAFFNDAFHAAHADAELILKKFADGANSAITEVVNIVSVGKASEKFKEERNGSNDIENGKSAKAFEVKGRRSKDSKRPARRENRNAEKVKIRERGVFKVVIREQVALLKRKKRASESFPK